MIDSYILTDILTSVAGFITSVSIIGGAFYKWIWKPYIEQKEIRELKHQKKMEEISEEQMEPLLKQLEVLTDQNKRHDDVDKQLNEIAEQNIQIIQKMQHDYKDHEVQANQRDRLITQNAEILKNHEERLDVHADRILVLETVSGLKPRIISNREEI